MRLTRRVTQLERAVRPRRCGLCAGRGPRRIVVVMEGEEPVRPPCGACGAPGFYKLIVLSDEGEADVHDLGHDGGSSRGGADGHALVPGAGT